MCLEKNVAFGLEKMRGGIKESDEFKALFGLELREE